MSQKTHDEKLLAKAVHGVTLLNRRRSAEAFERAYNNFVADHGKHPMEKWPVHLRELHDAFILASNKEADAFEAYDALFREDS